MLSYVKTTTTKRRVHFDDMLLSIARVPLPRDSIKDQFLVGYSLNLLKKEKKACFEKNFGGQKNYIKVTLIFNHI